MMSPIRKQPVTFTASVPHGKRAPNRVEIAVPARYRASEPAPPQSTIHTYFIARSFRLQTLGDFLFVDGSGFDQAPVRLGDVDRGGAAAGAGAAIEHQVYAAVHHAEYLDAAAAGRMAGDVGAGRDQGLVQQRSEERRV